MQLLVNLINNSYSVVQWYCSPTTQRRQQQIIQEAQEVLSVFSLVLHMLSQDLFDLVVTWLSAMDIEGTQMTLELTSDTLMVASWNEVYWELVGDVVYCYTVSLAHLGWFLGDLSNWLTEQVYRVRGLIATVRGIVS